ncbi:UbiA prenyltransferase family protein [Candidatus Dojkabacteria bacterium]|nr:UbiA prenyltransferase family protein [Candidatus Dojkabacteria bacterium]
MKIYELLSLFRVKQWVKNLIIFLPLFFSSNLLIGEDFIKTLYAFLSLCFLTSSVYIFNDIIDRERDSHHPKKKSRLISSGKISLLNASLLSALSLATSLLISSYFVKSEYFLLFLFGYLAIMILYTLYFKHIGIIDAIIISLGFVLRVIVGSVILELDLSAMLLVAVIGSAILISFGKRKAEISSLGIEEAVKHRPALSVYPKGVLDIIISTVTSVTFFAYIMYCYGYETTGLKLLLDPYLPPRFHEPQWLLLTIPFAFYVMTRYIILIYKGESTIPEDIWIKDGELRTGIIVWLLILFLLIYFEQFSRMF